MKCIAHPQYRGKRKPKIRDCWHIYPEACDDCWKFYLSEEKRRWEQKRNAFVINKVSKFQKGIKTIDCNRHGLRK